MRGESMNQLSSIPFADNSITIYNQVKVKNASGKVFTKWFRTVIPNCYVKVGGATTQQGSIILSDVKNLVKIPLFDNFKEPYSYSQLTSEEIENYFTIASGSLIVTMAVDDIIDDFSTDLDIKKKYGTRAFTVSSTTLNIGADRPHQHIIAIES